ncbi:CTR copper uptake transporter [Mycena pura]|uniref:Copper transport protein n=1 Tax=Mycena pura TaxID=153505 RepID=A0AAD6V451_9AGAR|nr:CTR copper uptake transporter [Mycena pura]
MRTARLPLPALALLIAHALVPMALADTRNLPRAAVNGMDMTMDDGMTLANGTMLPMLHFMLGDTLFFEGWVPQTRGALFGACVGLFLLTLADRALAAMRALAEAQWRRAPKADCDDKDKKKKKGRLQLQAPPFVLAHDAMRGAMHALQALLGFTFMLAVMTFQGAYIITLVGGLGVGEMLFGRYRAAAADGGH